MAVVVIGCAFVPAASVAEQSLRKSSSDDVVFYAGGPGNQRFYAVTQLSDGTVLGDKSWPDDNLDNWPMYTSGWPDLNTTKCRPTIQTDAEGNVYVIGTGRRPVTTRNAYMQMPRPGEAESRWSDFVRVYSQDLTTLRYSTILTGNWDWKTKEGGSGVNLQGLIPTKGGLFAVGNTTVKEKHGDLGTTDMPTKNKPAWSANRRTGEMGVVARFSIERSQAE